MSAAALVGVVDASPVARARVSSLSAAETAIRECANRNRRAAGLEPLAPSSVLTKAARLAAKDMATQGFFSHVDPEGRDPEDRVRIFDPEGRFVYIGENIAAGYSSVHAACVGWMHSPGHRANILNGEYTHIGGGFATGGPYHRYYVQVFAMLASSEEEAP